MTDPTPPPLTDEQKESLRDAPSVTSAIGGDDMEQALARLDYLEGAVLDGAECHELTSLYICHGMRPPELHPGHPLWTGYLKISERQDENHPRFSTPLKDPE